MRSKTNSIQLLAIVKRKILDKYGMETVLQPIMDDLEKLVKLIDMNLLCAMHSIHRISVFHELYRKEEYSLYLMGSEPQYMAP